MPRPVITSFVMENLSSKSATFSTVNDGTGPEEVQRVLDTLARLHAHYWDSPRLKTGGDLAWVENEVDGQLETQFFQATFRQSVPITWPPTASSARSWK